MFKAFLDESLAPPTWHQTLVLLRLRLAGSECGRSTGGRQSWEDQRYERRNSHGTPAAMGPLAVLAVLVSAAPIVWIVRLVATRG